VVNVPAIVLSASVPRNTVVALHLPMPAEPPIDVVHQAAMSDLHLHACVRPAKDTRKNWLGLDPKKSPEVFLHVGDKLLVAEIDCSGITCAAEIASRTILSPAGFRAAHERWVRRL
jgi:hypothetical protein